MLETNEVLFVILLSYLYTEQEI